MSLKLWINGARPRTLPASVAPVVVGAAAGWERLQRLRSCVRNGLGIDSCVGNTAHIDLLESRFAVVTVLCTLTALFLQIAVNFANDYADGIRGVDEGRSKLYSAGDDLCTGSGTGAGADTANVDTVDTVPDTVTDTSGTAAVPCTTLSEPASQPEAKAFGAVRHSSSQHAPIRLVASGVSPRHVLVAAGSASAVACICGIAAIAITGHWWLLAVGVCCLIAGWFYTGGQHPYGYTGFGELAVFVFFGLVAVLGTEYLAADGVDVGGVVGAIYCGVLSSVMLMVNNIRDLDSDRKHGKRTLAVRMGGPVARWFLMFVYCIAALPTAFFAIGQLVMSLANWAGIACTSSTVFCTTDNCLICVPIAPSLDDILLGLLGAVLLIVVITMIRALIRHDYVAALPLSSITLLLYAVIFICFMPSVMAAAGLAV